MLSQMRGGACVFIPVIANMRLRRASLRKLSAAARVVRVGIFGLLTSCHGKEPTPPVVVPGTLSLTLSPETVQVTAGSSGTVAAGIVRGGSFTGAVTVRSSAPPSGVNVAIAAATLTAGVTSTVLTVTVDSSLRATSISLIITAEGTGVSAASVTLTIAVASPPPPPTLTLALLPRSGATQPGGTISARAVVVRGGSPSGSVTLAHTGAPTGVTVAFTPAPLPIGSDTASVVVTVGTAVAPGAYPIAITATATGVASAPDTLTVTVSAPPVAPRISRTYCATRPPVWVAVRDGTGSWVRVLPTSGTTYEFELNAGKGGLATVYDDFEGVELQVVYATASEFRALVSAPDRGFCTSKFHTGSFVNFKRSDVLSVGMSYASASRDSQDSTKYLIGRVRTGPLELVATRSASATSAIEQMILRRGIDLPQDGVIAPLDFTSSEAFAPTGATFSVSGLGADTARAVTRFDGVRGSSGISYDVSAAFVSSGSPVHYLAIPESRLASSEVQDLSAAVSSPGDRQTERGAGVFFRRVTDRVLELGPINAMAAVSRMTGGAYPRPRVQLTAQTEYDRDFYASFAQFADRYRSSIRSTVAYRGASAAWDESIPDLSSAAGWQSRWAPKDIPFDWFLTVSGGANFLYDSTITDGATYRYAARWGATPVP